MLWVSLVHLPAILILLPVEGLDRVNLMEIEVLADADSVARKAAALIAAEARQAVAARGRFVLAVSGGRTPWLMLGALAGEKVPWEELHLVQVDERIAPAESPFLCRSAGSSNTGNSAAALLACVRVAPEKPANAATRMMPGVSNAMRSISRTISVVRASEAAPGNCTETMT